MKRSMERREVDRHLVGRKGACVVSPSPNQTTKRSSFSEVFDKDRSMLSSTDSSSKGVEFSGSLQLPVSTRKCESSSSSTPMSETLCNSRRRASAHHMVFVSEDGSMLEASAEQSVDVDAPVGGRGCPTQSDTPRARMSEVDLAEMGQPTCERDCGIQFVTRLWQCVRGTPTQPLCERMLENTVETYSFRDTFDRESRTQGDPWTV